MLNQDLTIEVDALCKGKSYTRTAESMRKVDAAINSISATARHDEIISTLYNDFHLYGVVMNSVNEEP